MTVWFVGSMMNVNEAVNRHLGCQASPAAPEEGAVDRAPCSLTPVWCWCGVAPRGYRRNGCWLSQGLRSVAKQPALRWGCLR